MINNINTYYVLYIVLVLIYAAISLIFPHNSYYMYVVLAFCFTGLFFCIQLFINETCTVYKIMSYFTPILFSVLLIIMTSLSFNEYSKFNVN